MKNKAFLGDMNILFIKIIVCAGFVGTGQDALGAIDKEWIRIL